MGFYWIKTNRIIKWFFNRYVWDFPCKSKTVYLTFDDGPTAEQTIWILDQLKRYEAKATFFCIGKNIVNNRQLFEQIKQHDHSLGNHTYSHVNGWRLNTEDYINDVNKCDEAMCNTVSVSDQTKLFRPPYGKIRSKQASHLLKKGYKIIMWDVISADFDQNISPIDCYRNVINHVKSGSIIVFHDSIKAQQNLRFALPKILKELQQLGYSFKSIK